MNSFETDLKRAFGGLNFWAGLLLECVILFQSGPDSDLFRISVPVLASVPYSTAWINEYQSGYLKEYLPRCGRNAYILGKFFSCGVSGGALTGIACLFYLYSKSQEEISIDVFLVFLSGMFWAVVAAALAAASNSRYVAYGGSFVLFHALVILYERYFVSLYCLYPVEWFAPTHTWVFGNMGIVLMCGSMIMITGIFYYEILRRCIERV